MATDTPVRLVTIDEAATFVHCHPRTINRMAKRGELRLYRLGSLVRVDLDELVRTMGQPA